MKISFDLVDDYSSLVQLIKLDEELFYGETGLYIDNDNCVYWLLKVGTKVVGFCGVDNSNKQAKLLKSAILDKYRGKSYQLEMIKHRLKYLKDKKCQSVYTYTSVDNFASINNLIKAGFKACEFDQDVDGFIGWSLKLKDK